MISLNQDNSIGYIYHLNLPIEKPAPTYAFDMGSEIPVLVCVQRAGYMTFGVEDYQTFDYDSTELIYRLFLHSPHTKYKIRWTYYHQEPNKIKLQFNVDNILHRNRWVHPGEVVIEDAWIPDACIHDNEITIKIKVLNGTIAVLSGLEIGKHEVGAGGPQGGEALNPSLNALCLLPMYPNPSKGILRIRFISPDERNITVKLYDVTGRLSRIVFNDRAKIGQNEIVLRPQDLAAGVYFLHLESGDYKKTEKIVFLR